MIAGHEKPEHQIYWWPQGGKLIFLQEEATPEFWDQQWDTDDWKKTITQSRNSRNWSNILKRYFPDKDSVILEGGCGVGHLVDAMNHLGYKAIGVDYATNTVSQIKKVMPSLDVRVGDVRTLDFEDDYFDGYWSMGVIEHFWEGYDDIVKEMKRVLKPGGRLVLSFPHISLLDRVRVLLLLDKRFSGTDKPDGFFQFALDAKAVRRDFESEGFRLLGSQRKGGLLGLSRYSNNIRRFSDYLNGTSRNSRLAKIIRFGLDCVLSPFCGHSILLIMQKT